MHPDERTARQQLAACYRIFAQLGWVEMIYNHITLRLPDSVTGGEKHFLINPFGLHYNEVTASNLVKVNLAGVVLDGSRYPINPAGSCLRWISPADTWSADYRGSSFSSRHDIFRRRPGIPRRLCR